MARSESTPRRGTVPGIGQRTHAAELTPKQSRFVAEYLANGLNASAPISPRTRIVAAKRPRQLPATAR